MTNKATFNVVVHTQVRTFGSMDRAVSLTVPVDITASDLVQIAVDTFKTNTHSKFFVQNGISVPSPSQSHIIPPSSRDKRNRNYSHSRSNSDSSSCSSSSDSSIFSDDFNTVSTNYCLYEACFLSNVVVNAPELFSPSRANISNSSFKDSNGFAFPKTKRPSVDSTNSLSSVEENISGSQSFYRAKDRRPSHSDTQLRKLIRNISPDEYPVVIAENWKYIDSKPRKNSHGSVCSDRSNDLSYNKQSAIPLPGTIGNAITDPSCLHFLLKEVESQSGKCLYDIRKEICKQLPLDKLQNRLSMIEMEELVENKKLRDRYKMQRQELLRLIRLESQI